MSKYIFIILFIVFSFTQANQHRWLELITDSITIYYSPSHSRLAEKIVNYSNTVLKELVFDLNLLYQGRTQIFLAENSEVWDALTNHQLPSWSPAVTVNRGNGINILLSPASFDNYQTILRHELIHVIMNKNFEDFYIPRWFAEGTAIYYSKERFFSYGVILSKANLTNSLISLDDVENVLDFKDNKANLAYATSYAGVQYIIDHYGYTYLSDFIRELRLTHDWSNSVINIFDVSYEEFQQECFEFIREHFWWNFLFQLDLLLWLILSLFVLFIFIMIKRRNKQTIEQWESETESCEQAGY